MTEAATANPVHDWIAKSVAENPVILFMKGVPEQPVSYTHLTLPTNREV